MKSRPLFGIVLLFISATCFADSANQYVLGQDVKTSSKLTSGKSSASSFVSGSAAGKLDSQTGKQHHSAHVKGKSGDVLKGKTSKAGSNYAITGSQSKSTEFIKVDSSRYMSNVYDTGNSSLRFSYLYDQYDVQDERGVYKNTFDADHSSNYGNLFVSYGHYFYRGFVDFSWVANAGVGHKSGVGTFKDTGERSETEFKLWMVPIDGHLGMGIPMSNWAKLSVSGGPSVMALLQSRDDFEDGEEGKRKNQYSYGYSASALLQLSLAKMFVKDAHKLHNEYQLTQMYFNFESRYQSYSNFQDSDLSIEGLALGGSVSFEFQ